MEKSKPKSQNANSIHAHETVQTLSVANLTLPPYISILWIWQKFWQVLERIKTFQLLAIQLSHLVQQSFNYSSALLLQLPWSALPQLLPFWFSRTAVACHFVFINVQKLNTLYLFRTLNSSHLSRMLFKILFLWWFYFRCIGLKLFPKVLSAFHTEMKNKSCYWKICSDAEGLYIS